MGNIQSAIAKQFSALFSMFKGGNQASLAILGLDSAGKSTLVNLFRDTNIPTVPTLGFNVEEIVIANTTIKVWDVGGQQEFIAYWNDYVRGVDGLVFVVDVADDKRFKAAYEGFEGAVSQLQDRAPVLILLNKKDLVPEREKLAERTEQVQRIFCGEGTDGYGSGEGVVRAGGRVFKNRIIPVSVKADLTKMSEAGRKWSVQETTVYPGFKWLLDEIKSGEWVSH